jgi:hydroxyacylglutathione hydrolase
MAGTNCYVVAPAAGEQCVVIDPGYQVGAQVDEIIARHRLHPVAVLLTHGHLDHTFSVLPVCQARDVPAYIHPQDRAALSDPWTGLGQPVGSPIFGMSGLTFAEPDDLRLLADGQSLPIAGLNFVVRHAPGHTPGSVVFASDGTDGTSATGSTSVTGGPSAIGSAGLTDGLGSAGVLFSGDVLFAGSIGRVDLPGGSMSAMQESLRQVILPLDDGLTVLPGHGPQTTIGRERASNPYLRALR